MVAGFISGSAMPLIGFKHRWSGLHGMELVTLNLQNSLQIGSASVQDDLEGMKNMFSICVSNVDDHLRNHGFILILLRMAPLHLPKY
jgi:serine/threonine-protein kinase HipA